MSDVYPFLKEIKSRDRDPLRSLAKQKRWTPIRLVKGVPVSITQFLSKNQLAKEGPDSVAPVVIPALAPTLDKSLKPDRSLCPVRALPLKPLHTRS